MRVISREERHIKRIIWHQSVVVCVWSGRTGDAIGCRCESRSAFPVEASASAIAHPTNPFIYLALLDRRLHPKHILANKIRKKISKKKQSEHKTRSASCDGEKKTKTNFYIFSSFAWRARILFYWNHCERWSATRRARMPLHFSSAGFDMAIKNELWLRSRFLLFTKSICIISDGSCAVNCCDKRAIVTLETIRLRLCAPPMPQSTAGARRNPFQATRPAYMATGAIAKNA